MHVVVVLKSLTVSFQGIFLVYDITSERSFQHIMKWASDVDEVSQCDLGFKNSINQAHFSSTLSKGPK